VSGSPGLPAEPGWYRLTGSGWERVDDDDAQAQLDARADGWQNLMHVQSAAMAETPLF
jgi:hypothetical protein